MDLLKEINDLAYVFLVDIKDKGHNGLSIFIKAGVVSNETEELIIGEKSLGQARSVRAAGTNYEIRFDTYATYQITNESIAIAENNALLNGMIFCVYSTSSYIDYIRSNTLIDALNVHERKLLHYSFFCQGQVIDVISSSEPILAR